MQFANLNRSLTDFGNRLRPVTRVLLKVLVALYLLLLLLMLLDPYLRDRHDPLHDWVAAILMLCMMGMIWEMMPPAPVPYMPWKEWRRRQWRNKSWWWGVLVCVPASLGMVWVFIAHRYELPVTLYVIGCTLLTIVVRPHRRWPLY